MRDLKQRTYAAKEKELAVEILRYLVNNPEAKDTLEGISRWWLGRSLNAEILVNMESAISYLISKKLIIEARRKGLPPYYSLNATKQDEIINLLHFQK